MAINIPSNLKSADISRFVLRAAQLEKAKPIIAYWCKSARHFLSRNLTLTQIQIPVGYFWVVKQIISKGLHNVDHESKNFTTGLMDKLEQVCVLTTSKIDSMLRSSLNR